VQTCAKYGKSREIYVPTAAVDALDNFLPALDRVVP
jgi:hypothetical protein